MNSGKILREQLIQLLEGHNAHVSFKQAVKDFPMEKINQRTSGIPLSGWQLLEHLRIAQADILDFIINPGYRELKWPDQYWPEEGNIAEETDWNDSVNAFEEDLQRIKGIVNNSETDFFGPIPHAKNYTIFREILLVADHNAYHIGQLVWLRKALGIWK